jgi:hypothetical protein
MEIYALIMWMMLWQDGEKMTELCDLGRHAVRNKAVRESRCRDNG